jgi:hypothetical protein
MAKVKKSAYKPDWRAERKHIVSDFAYGVYKEGVRDWAVAIYPSKDILKALAHASQLGDGYQCSAASFANTIVK